MYLFISIYLSIFFTYEDLALRCRLSINIQAFCKDYSDYIRYGFTTDSIIRFAIGAYYYLIHNICSYINSYNSFLFVRCNGCVDGDVYRYV